MHSTLTNRVQNQAPPVLPHSWHLDPCKYTSPTRPIKVATRTRQDDARPTGKDRVLLSRGPLVRVQPGAPFQAPVGLEGQIRREHCECKGPRTGPLGFYPARKRGPGRAELQGDRNAGRPQGDTEHPGGAMLTPPPTLGSPLPRHPTPLPPDGHVPSVGARGPPTLERAGPWTSNGDQSRGLRIRRV